MTKKMTRIKPRRVAQGQRKHVRRMKQEARKGNVPDNKLKKVIPVVAAPKP